MRVEGCNAGAVRGDLDEKGMKVLAAKVAVASTNPGWKPLIRGRRPVRLALKKRPLIKNVCHFEYLGWQAARRWRMDSQPRCSCAYFESGIIALLPPKPSQLVA